MKHLSASILALAFAGAAATSGQQNQPEARNMALVGYHDLQARSAYQPVVHKQGERWIAYIGHHGERVMNSMTGQQEYNGTSILDVTDPKHPVYLAHVPGEGGQGEAGGAQMVRIWDVTDPARPSLLTTVVKGLQGTHKSWWECDTGIAYLISGQPGWRAKRMTKIYDLSDPAKPVFIRDFGLPGHQPGATGDLPADLHGPIPVLNRNRVYFGYGTSRGGVLQIVDREKLLKGPKEPTEANLRYPHVGRLDLPPNVGAHTVFPVLGVEVPEFARHTAGRTRDFVVITNESTRNECEEARQMVWVADISTESTPATVATWTVPEKSGDFCGKGGRFGTHSSNESFAPIYYKKVMFFAHFNAGVRALDIRDPFHPTEIGYYIPATTDKTTTRCVGTGANERCKIAIQTNNVEVDERGYIYIVDRANTGLHILELTGPAREVSGSF